MFYTSFFFFNDTATTEIYTLSLHDALPISETFSSTAFCADPINVLLTALGRQYQDPSRTVNYAQNSRYEGYGRGARSEEHTSELQSRQYLVCRLLLEKKKNNDTSIHTRATK